MDAISTDPTPNNESHALLVSEAATHIASEWSNASENSYFFEEVQEFTRDFSVDTLHRFKSLVVGQMNLLVDGLIHRDWNEDRANDYISIAEVAERQHVYSQEINQHLNALTHYELTPIVPGQPYPSERASQCKAVFETAIILRNRADDEDLDSIYMEADGNMIPYIQDNMLRHLVVNSDRRDEVVSVLRARKTSDPDVILSVMNHDVPAVANGLL